MIWLRLTYYENVQSCQCSMMLPNIEGIREFMKGMKPGHVQCCGEELDFQWMTNIEEHPKT